jgi:hypothetical protein
VVALVAKEVGDRETHVRKEEEVESTHVGGGGELEE